MKVTVTTPTGNIGSKLVPLLLERGAEVTVIARNPDKIKDLASRGVKVIKGEHSDAGVLKRGFEGADALFLLIPPDYQSHDPIGYYKKFADVAASVAPQFANVHVVLLSSVGANRSEGTGVIRGLHVAEERLRPVVKNLSMLRANFFMENVFGSLPTILKDGAMYMTNGPSNKLPQVATGDIAGIAADVILEHKPGQHLIDVLGPEELSFEQVGEHIGKAIGKPVKAVIIPPDAYQGALQQAGFSKELTGEFVAMQKAIDSGLATELVGDEQRRGKITYPQFVREAFLPAYQQAKSAAA